MASVCELSPVVVPASLRIMQRPDSANTRPPVLHQGPFREPPRVSAERSTWKPWARHSLPSTELNWPLWKGWESRDTDLFTTLTFALEESGWMFACILRMEKGLNGAHSYGFVQPVSLCLSSSLSRMFTALKRVPWPSCRVERTVSDLFFILLITPGLLQYLACLTSPKYYYGKDLEWFLFLFLISIENWTDRLELHS